MAFLVVSVALGATWVQAQTSERPVLGLDTSRYQGRVDYAKVAAQGYTYCFLKATQGGAYVDPDYAHDLALARAAGLAVGAYHFFVVGDSPQEQFRNFVQHVTLLPGDLPPVIDVEHMSGAGPELAGELRVLLALLEAQYRVQPILYSGRSFAGENLSGFGAYRLWLAEYEVAAPQLPRGFRDWSFWQHSSQGHVDGIEGDVDLDVFHGDLAAFASLRLAQGYAPRGSPCSDVTCNHHFEPGPVTSPSAPRLVPPPTETNPSVRNFVALVIATSTLAILLAAWWWARRPPRAPHRNPPATVVVDATSTSQVERDPDTLDACMQQLKKLASTDLQSRQDAVHALARRAHDAPAERAAIVHALSRFVRDALPRAGSSGAVDAPRELEDDVKMALQRLAELGGLQLPGGDLRACLLQGAQLEGAQLHGANLQGANLQGASLRRAVLDGANLQGAYLQGAFLERASLQGAFLAGAFLAGAELVAAKLAGAFMQRANLPGSNLQAADMSGTNLPEAHLPGAHLIDCDLRGANLRGANLQGCDLRHSRLDDCALYGARLEGARTQGASMELALRADATPSQQSPTAQLRAS